MLSGKSLRNYSNLFSLDDYKKTEKIIYINILRTNMSSSEFQLKKKKERGSYLLEEIKDNGWMREKYKKTFKYLNYVEHLLNLASTITGFVSISEFSLLVCVPVGITSSAIGRKMCNNCINQKV